MKKYPGITFSILLFLMLLIVNLLELNMMRLNKTENGATPSNAEYEQQIIEKNKKDLICSILFEEGKEFIKLYEADYKNADINNFYKKSETEYILDYNVLNERYICKMVLSEKEIPNSLFVMDNSDIKFEQENYKELKELLKYTNFSVEEYSLEKLDYYELEKVSNYNVRLYISIKDKKVQVYLRTS